MCCKKQKKKITKNRVVIFNMFNILASNKQEEFWNNRNIKDNLIISFFCVFIYNYLNNLHIVKFFLLASWIYVVILLNYKSLKKI